MFNSSVSWIPTVLFTVLLCYLTYIHSILEYSVFLAIVSLLPNRIFELLPISNLLYVRPSNKCFIFTTSSGSQNGSDIIWITLNRKWGLRCLNHVPMVKHLESGRERFKPRSTWLQNTPINPYSLLHILEEEGTSFLASHVAKHHFRPKDDLTYH